MRLYGIVAIAAIVGGFAIYDNHDKNTNFQPVDARISAVSEQCYMEKVERGVITKTTSTSGLVGCGVAAALVQTHPKWQGYDVKHKIEIQLTYVSPVDKATHATSLRMSSFPRGQPLREGDVFRILASKTKADKTREF